VVSAVPLRDVFPRSQKDAERKTLVRQRRLQKYSQIQYLKARGYGQRQIARLLSLSRATVRAYYLAESFPERKTNYRPSQLDPYISHLQQRWEEGCRKAQTLWQEILELVYTGKVKQVMKWMRNQRKKASSELSKKPEGFLETDWHYPPSENASEF
jgi:predicted transcriptional regulator